MTKHLRPTEHSEQVAVVEWAEWNAKRCPELHNLFAVPNAGQRHPAVGKKMRLEGLKKGMLDLVLACPRGEYHGLFIEMKVKPNKPTTEQRDWIQRLVAQGYCVQVCYGADAAIEAIRRYLEIKL